MKIEYSLDRDWIAREIHLPILKKLEAITASQIADLSDRDFCVEYYQNNATEFSSDDCFILLCSFKGYLVNFLKSLKIINLCLEKAPGDIINSLTCQTRIMIEVYGLLHYYYSKNLEDQLDLARIQRLRILAKKIQIGPGDTKPLREAYAEQFEFFLKTATHLSELKEPEKLSGNKFKSYFGSIESQISSINTKDGSFAKKFKETDGDHSLGMYRHMSDFVHSDPLANSGVSDQSIWISFMSFRYSGLILELLDQNIFSLKYKDSLDEALKLFKKNEYQLSNLAEIK